MAGPQKRLKVFTPEDVARHTRPGDVWVTRKGKVYQVSAFVEDHPGGDDLILKYAGKDVEAIMDDPDEHSHSDSAYDILDQFQIGVLGSSETVVSEDVVIDDDFHPEETDVVGDYKKNQFLDLEKPLIMQVWRANFSKSYYLKQVHQPRHLPHPARLFGPSYLEVFTRTPWYVVPIFWLPITAAIFARSMQQQVKIDPASGAWNTTLYEAFLTSAACFLLGNFLWTIIEYGMHRFLFHIDDILPDRPFFLMLHFTMHGVHHYLPADRLRLVMPPLLFAALSFPFTRLAYAIFPAWMANGVIAGAFAFYVLYDCMHFALHHTKLPKYLKQMKTYHMAHHYKNYEMGFGVTSKLWDYIFGTELAGI
jgi:4-hydroxysphinganine ceramide fatty acyl 2-hydroxylase